MAMHLALEISSDPAHGHHPMEGIPKRWRVAKLLVDGVELLVDGKIIEKELHTQSSFSHPAK